MSAIARMMGRPSIAMGSFMAAINRNWGLSVAWQNHVAGAEEHPRTSGGVVSTDVAYFGQRHNVLDNRTAIRMIVPRGWFEFG